MTFWRRASKDDGIVINAHDLDQIGFRNELLRNQIEEIEYGLRQVDSFKESFRGIVTPISGALEELETTRSELQETQAKLAVATDALTDLHARHFAQSSEFELAKAQIENLSQERGDLDRRVKFVQFALEERSAAADHRMHELETARAQLQTHMRKVEEQATELQGVKAELDEKYRAAGEFEQALAIASDQNSLLLQKVDSLRRANEGHIEQITKLLRRESDLEAELEQANARIDEQRSALAQAEIAQGMARLQHEEAADRLIAEKTSILGQLETSEDRAATIERLLDEARQQLGAKVGEARALELKLHEQTLRTFSLEKKFSSVQEDLAEVETRLIQTDTARQALVERSKTLVETMEAKSAALEKAETRIQYLNGRLEELAQSLQDQRGQWEQQVLELTQGLEKQRAERVFAEGALLASRRARFNVTVHGELGGKGRSQDGDRTEADDSHAALNIAPREQPAGRDPSGIKLVDLRAKAS